MMRATSSILSAITSATIFSTLASAQTYSSCNPLLKSGCTPDPALGRSITADFTSGASNDFTASGGPTYNSNGASFTVAKPGDSPQLTSKWYIMFGKVDIVMKAAPGAGIVSSAVLQSDALDEIDWEWLGADPNQVQSNYFGKGQTGSYNRGAFHADPNSQSAFKTYTIDWTASQVAWQIDGTTVRTLAPADANGQYPQTPMQIKVGAWSGGDAGNAQGTIQWARGPTDYSQGPFTMQVKSITVTDYSTGKQYVYSGTSGTWQSITAVGGTVNSGGSGSSGSSGSSGASAVVVPVPSGTGTSSGAPQPYDGTHQPDTTSTYVTPTVYPWVPQSTTLSTSVATATSYPGLPDGWKVSSGGKVVPPSSAPSTYPSALPTSRPPVSCAGSSGDKLQVITAYDQRGFLTTMTVPFATGPPSYDSRGFLISAQAACTAAVAAEPAIAGSAQATSAAGSAALTASGTVVSSPTGQPAGSASRSVASSSPHLQATALQAQATGGAWQIPRLNGAGAACALLGAALL